MLSLREALKFGRLEEFIAQEEARGVGRGALRRMDRALARMLGQARSENASAHAQARRRRLDRLACCDLGFLSFITSLV